MLRKFKKLRTLFILNTQYELLFLMQYDHKKIEEKWQKKWEEEGIYQMDETSDKPASSAGRPKAYILDMFPYPSGAGLHVGHPKGYIGTDIYSRFKRMNNYFVLHPMGWDAFGLPAEEYAIKNKMHPATATQKNIARYKEQLKMIGLSYDWSREIDTTDPDYYRWTQWAFLQMFKRGLAYLSHEPINWCPSCKTGLANEDLEDGKCERCGSPVEQKPIRQWVLKIREYADRMLEDLEELDWPESVKESQRNWIGRSEGAQISFPLDKKFHFVLLHGYKSSPKGAFFEWLREELEARGHTVDVPTLPNARDPDVLEQVETVLKETTFDENTIVLGHSLGSVVAAKAIEERGVKIHKLVTVAGFVLKDGTERFQKYIKSDHFSCDYEEVRKNIGSAIVLQDTEDRLVSDEMAENLSRVLEAKLVKRKARKPHFRKKEEPEVLQNLLEKIDVFTTRPDTLFGATYMVLAPEHKLIESLKSDITNWKEVKKYRDEAIRKTPIDRTAEGKEKTGVKLEGVNAINPANGETIPIFIADYVLAHYGTGAIMAVPAHDERDFAFAKKYSLPAKEVVSRFAKSTRTGEYDSDEFALPYSELGFLVNSTDRFNGMDSEEAKGRITEYAGGEMKTTYRLQNWVFSRQRYWGEPIPLIHCEKCGVVPVPESELPVKLPDVEHYEPTGTAESPLAGIEAWVSTTCPTCGGEGRRETNTMPQWAGSCWYYLRFMDPENNEKLVDPVKEKYWAPVDLYVGGVEHATRHLIYARFWHKFLYDIGVVSTKEPFRRLQNQGLIVAQDGRKMSKRYGNVINPDDIVERVGADTLRVYEMFMGPFDQSISWSTDHMVGSRRFLERVWRLREKVDEKNTGNDLETNLHKTIKKVTDDIESLAFNTAISQMMIFVNEMEKKEKISKKKWKVFLKLLAPFAPHITEELWREAGEKRSIHLPPWPKYDAKKAEVNEREIAVQVNGKVRGVVCLSVSATEEEAIEKALESSEVARYIAKEEITKIVYRPGKILSLVGQE